MQLGSPGKLGDVEPDDFCGNLRYTILFFANLKKELASEVHALSVAKGFFRATRLS